MKRIPTFDLDAEIAKLAETADIEPATISAQVSEIINKEGKDPFTAIIMWKGRNGFALGTGLNDYFGRVVAKEGVQTKGDGSQVSRVHFAVEDADSREIVFKPASLWNDRITTVGDLLELDKCYTMKASAKKDGSLIRLDKIKVMKEPAPIPTFALIPATALADVPNIMNGYTVLDAWVSRKIKDAAKVNELGMDIADLNSPTPITVWYGGQYTPVSTDDLDAWKALEEGDHVRVFGYVSKKGSVNAVRIDKLE